MAAGGAESRAGIGEWRSGICVGDTAAGDSVYSDERRGVWREKQRGEWAVFDGDAVERWGRGELGSGGSVRVWDGDWEGIARAGIQHDFGWRREYYAGAAERPNV